jgi:hypothetical protein
MEINLDNVYWERIKGFISENKIDARWKLKKLNDDKTYGSLRIVSHPDLKPGYLRSMFMYVTTINSKSKSQIIKSLEDFQMEDIELEVYSIDNEIKTETKTIELPFKELEQMYSVKIFE